MKRDNLIWRIEAEAFREAGKMALLAVAVLMPANGDADMVALRGIGTDSCGKFLAAVSENRPGKGFMLTNIDGNQYWSESEVYAEWIQGYISGANLESPESSRKQIAVDYPGTELWVRKWCDAHPAEPLANAVISFVRSQWGLPREK